MPNTIICGGIAIDDISLPKIKLVNEVGGSAVYASLAASIFCPTLLAGIIGNDFPKEFGEVLKDRGIDTQHIQHSEKPTFRWKGKYTEDLSSITVIDQQLNAYHDFQLDGVVSAARRCKTIFFSNIDPEIQLKIIDKIPKRTIKLLDSMDLWIVEKRDLLIKVLEKVDIFFIGLKEATLLVEEDLPVYEMVNKILSYGPKVVVLKKGEYGLSVYGSFGTLAVPSYPLTHAIDPSGAGDSLGGAIAGVLARVGELNKSNLFASVLLGSIVSSFVVEGYATQSLQQLSLREVINRTKTFLRQLPNANVLFPLQKLEDMKI